MRRAVGDAAGLTIKAQVRQAARHLGYADDDWRAREAWYGRAGAWSAAALDELRARHAAWRKRECAQVGSDALSQRLAAVRDGLVEMQRRFDELDAEVGRLLSADRQGP